MLEPSIRTVINFAEHQADAAALLDTSAGRTKSLSERLRDRTADISCLPAGAEANKNDVAETDVII